MLVPPVLKRPIIPGIIISIFTIILFGIVSCATSLKRSADYIKIPRVYSNEDSLIKYIIPNKKYVYWAYCNNTFKNPIRQEFGVRPKGLVIKSPTFFNTLFGVCLPIGCGKYFAYVDSGKVFYVDDTTKFKAFIGSIDNWQEAVLYTRITQQLYIDDDIRGGSYKIEHDTAYNLRMMRYFPCLETKQSVYVRVEKNQKIKDTVTLSTYYKSKDCAVY